MVACTHDTHCGIAAARRRNTHALHGCTHNTNTRTQARLFSTARRLVPIADRVLVKRVEHKTQTAGGIYLPTEQKVNEADVVAVGRAGHARGQQRRGRRPQRDLPRDHPGDRAVIFLFLH